MKLLSFAILLALISPGYCGLFGSLVSTLSSVANAATSTVKQVTNIFTPTWFLPSDDRVACHGLIGLLTMVLPLDMSVDSSRELKTKIYFASRKHKDKILMPFGDDFDLSKTDFDKDKKTVMIVHGFMSNGNVTWVSEMATAYLEREDVNVIIVNWSEGGGVLPIARYAYWKSVANTRGVGADISTFFKKLIAATNASPSNFHFIGHSLGAHICAYASNHINGVYRITGLDPAMPCYTSDNTAEVLDATDATFVDVIHTNVLDRIEIAFGIRQTAGHIDFYVNGGNTQPGCDNADNILLAVEEKIYGASEAVCSHGRAAILFTESLRNDNCSFIGYPWKFSDRVNSSMTQACDRGLCARMGILADKSGMQTTGSYYVVTTSDSKMLCSLTPAELL